MVLGTPMATTVARSGDECLKPGIGNWLLNKLLKQTFFWGKKYFFLKFHYIFHYKNFIKSLIFKIFFSACFALCWHFPRRYGVSSSICPNYLLCNIQYTAKSEKKVNRLKSNWILKYWISKLTKTLLGIKWKCNFLLGIH